MQIDKDLYTEVEGEILQFNFGETPNIRTTINKIRKADYKGEIGSVNRIFYSSLSNNLKKPLNFTQLELKSLDKANIYTWIAYTLYDDVLDDKDVELMSPANIFLRLSYREYLKAGLDIEFLNKYFLAVDLANTKELALRSDKSLDIKLYKSLLSNKSIAHCIGQLWIIEKLAPQKSDLVNRACHAYCAARQLSDDIYDWREDILQGHYTFATVSMLNCTDIKPGDAISQHDIEILNVAFWQSQLEHLCSEVIYFTELSLKSFNKILKKDSDYTLQFIVPIKQAAELAINDHKMKKEEFEETFFKRSSLSRSGRSEK